MWKEEKSESVDCGDEAAEWMHKFLNLKEDDKVRLGYHQEDVIPRRDCDKKPWSLFRKQYNRLMLYDTGPMDNFSAGIVLGASTSIVFGFLVYIGWRYAPFWGETRWRRVGTLQEIVFYPLKSGAGISLEEAICDTHGLHVVGANQHRIQDRCFVAFDYEKDAIVTNRDYPKLTLVKWNESGENYVTFQAPNETPITVIKPACMKENRRLCSLWNGDSIYVMDFGEAAAQWISQYLGLQGSKGRIHFGYFCPKYCQGRNFGTPLQHLKVDYPNISKRDFGVYCDFAPYTLITESSVKALKNELGRDGELLGPDWFRPNFIVGGSQEFEEDTWNYVKIGSAIFQNVMPCHRDLSCCIDPNTGIKSPKGEPFKTLVRCRRLQPNSVHQRTLVALGVGLGLRAAGQVHTGDEVFIADSLRPR